MNLLDKFDTITISTEKQISEADREFCVALKNAYDNARIALAELLFIWENMLEEQQKILAPTGLTSCTFISPDSSISVSKESIREKIHDMHKTFIKKIFSYFQSQYHISLSDYESIQNLLPKEPTWSFVPNYKQELCAYEEKMASLSLTYGQVLDTIFEQLGGRSLPEYAIFQIKDGCWEAAWRNDKPQFERDKQTVKLLSATNYNFEIYESTKKIMKGLAYFENQTAGLIPHEMSPFFYYHGPGDNAYDFEKLSKVSRIRLYRNGRVDIRFAEETYAVQFATEYLGTMPWKEAA